MLISSSLVLLMCMCCATTAFAQIRNDDHAQITSVIQQYYDAVTAGDPTTLEAIFHEGWHMKNLQEEDGKILLVEDKPTFVERLQRGPLPGYGDDRHITSIDAAYERLAIVRVDKPSSRSTTFFTLFKLDGEWVIVNKLCADATTAPE